MKDLCNQKFIFLKKKAVFETVNQKDLTFIKIIEITFFVFFFFFFLMETEIFFFIKKNLKKKMPSKLIKGGKFHHEKLLIKMNLLY